MRGTLLVITTALSLICATQIATAKEAIHDVAQGFGAGLHCNDKVNMEAGAAYLADELGSEEITPSVLADYLRQAAEALAIQATAFNNDGVNCKKVMDLYGPNGIIVPGLLRPANAENDRPTLPVIATTNIAGCQSEDHLQTLKATQGDDAALAVAAIRLGCGALVKEGTRATTEKVDLNQKNLCIRVAPDDVVWMMPEFDGCIWVQAGDVNPTSH